MQHSEPPSINPNQAFHEYLLKEFEASCNYQEHLANLRQQASQFYLTAVTLILGGAVTLATTRDGSNPFLILAVAAILIGFCGLHLNIMKAGHVYEDWYEKRLRAGIHRYYQKLDSTSFKEYGGEMLVHSHESAFPQPKYIRVPWTKARIVGYFGLTNGALIGIGAGVCAYIYLPILFSGAWSSPAWRILGVAFCLASILFIVCIYWMANRIKYSIEDIKKLFEKLKPVQDLRDGPAPSAPDPHRTIKS